MSQATPSKTNRSADEKRALLARLLAEKARAERPAADLEGHRLFEAAALREPGATAVVAADGSLTYAELNARANQLARRLRALGVGPDVPVAVCLERSTRLLVGLLGILKAGGAYVPIDPAYPAGRVAFMLEDCRASVVVTETAVVANLDVGTRQVVLLDLEGELSRESSSDFETAPGPDRLAYVIYTSGSTGTPKGVQVTRGALGNFLRSLRKIVGLEATDVLAAVTTVSFDIAALEFFLPLSVGARVELLSREEAADGQALASRLERSGVTFLQATPATWRILLETGWSGRPGMTLLCGGEALPRALADRLLDKGAALWNLYGPTETTIWSSAARVEPGAGAVPIGQPIAKTQLHVLDARLRPVPVGVPGELYIGGDGLARGYLGRPALTADRFLPDPFATKPGARMYRTGDLARRLADGGFECLGRVDHQVKIRGFRVELGEVEAALLAHPGVGQAVAVAREDASGEQALIAFHVPLPGANPTAAELREVARRALPDYMIPSAFVPLESMPLTPNGKVDRGALPDFDPASLTPTGRYVPPRSALEEAVASAFSAVLGVERVGALDSFFDLGGHSLMAAQVLGRIRDALGVELPLKDLFDVPTVSGLAHRVEDALKAGSGIPLPPITPVDRATEPPASFAQARLWFLDQLDPGQATYNLPVAVRLTGELDPVALEKAFAELLARHESLRTTFRDSGGSPVQVIAPTLAVSLPVVDLTDRPEPDREPEALRLLAQEAKQAFDLARGPLIRARLVKVGEREHFVIVNTHHSVSDGWSIGVLVRDMAALYDAFAQGRRSPLPPLPVRYADYAAWQRGWLTGDLAEVLIGFWTRRLAGLGHLELPTDRPRPPVRLGRGAERRMTMPTELVGSIRALGREEGATLFMTLLASFQVLLHRYSGQEDVAVGSPVAGRGRAELEDLIGFFANTVVFRGDLGGDPSFRELLERTRTSTLEALTHQDLPFDQVVTAARPPRDPSRTPLYQAMFALQNAPLPALETEGMTMTPVVVSSDVARADLTLFATELEDGLLAQLEYDVDLFDAATADRILAHWRILLEAAVADPDRPVATLPMLTEAEQRALSQGWDDPEAGSLDPSALEGLSDSELDSLIQQLESDHDA
jgi:amino acid adenylation domain-containing protein